MSINWLLLGGHQAQNREVITEQNLQKQELVTECYCPNGHSILADIAEFQGNPGLTLKLKNKTSEGMLVLSPIIGDKDRQFIDFDKNSGDVVDICCPSCSEAFPVYNVCPCGAHLVALFTSQKANFSQCIGICQRLGCLHSELLTQRDLRLYSRENYF